MGKSDLCYKFLEEKNAECHVLLGDPLIFDILQGTQRTLEINT